MIATGGDETCHRSGHTGEAGVLFNMERRRKGTKGRGPPVSRTFGESGITSGRSQTQNFVSANPRKYAGAGLAAIRVVIGAFFGDYFEGPIGSMASAL
jgi:hypothetical protein